MTLQYGMNNYMQGKAERESELFIRNWIDLLLSLWPCRLCVPAEGDSTCISIYQFFAYLLENRECLREMRKRRAILPTP